MEAEKKWDLISLSSIPLIMTLGNSMLIPILPQIAKQLNITSFQVSLLITVYSATAIVLIPVAGFLSDRYGRKKIILPSLLIAGIGGASAGLAGVFLKENVFAMILMGRVLQGIGAAGAAPIVMPLIGDMFHRESDISRGLGIVETANIFGKVLSPILGSLLAAVYWFLPFLTIPVFCLISIAMVAFLVKTPKQEEQAPIAISAFLHSTRQIFRQKGRWLYAIFAIGAIAMFVIFGILFYLSQTLEDEFGIGGVVKGLILAIPLASLCIASFLTGRGIGNNKILMKWLTFSGLALLTASIVSIGWFEHFYFVLTCLLFAGIGLGMALPCLDSFITEGIEKEHRGTVTSIFSSMRFIGVSVGPPVVSVLMGTTHRILFFTIAGTCAVAAVLSLFSIKPGHKVSTTGGAEKSASFQLEEMDKS